MDEIERAVERIVAVAEDRNLFHTTDDGYDVGGCFDEDDARAILDAIDYRAVVEALAELAGAIRCYSRGALPAEDRLDDALDTADRITAEGQ